MHFALLGYSDLFFLRSGLERFGGGFLARLLFFARTG